MSSPWRDARRLIASLTIALLFAACTGYVDVPPDQFEAATHDLYASHLIRTRNAEYQAQHFSLTDSTVVITELAPGDTRYRLEKPPFVIPRSEVESIARVKTNNEVPYIVFGSAMALIFLVIYATQGLNGAYD